MTDSKTIQLGAHWRAVISCTTGKGIVWLRLESDGMSKFTVFTCGLSPDMASAIAGTLEHAQLGVSETHKGTDVKVKVSWVDRQSDLVGVLILETAVGGAGSSFKEKTGRHLAAALRWGSTAAADSLPSGDDSIKSADQKRDDLMKGMFS